MTVLVVGVGLGRTGTTSLKAALEFLLGEPCLHMFDLADRPELGDRWLTALGGDPDWDAVLEGFAASVDWPGAAFWRELVDAYPTAKVLLSLRRTADEWWESARRTIFMGYHGDEPAAALGDHREALRLLYLRNGVDPADEAGSKEAYRRHLEEVRREVPADRLVEWMPGDDWGPLCAMLGTPVPSTPFPHLNSTESFRSRFALVS